MEEFVLYLSLKYAGDFQSIYDAILRKEKVDENLRMELKDKLKCNYTTLFNDDYPNALKQLNCPPFVLYYYGDLSLVNEATIAVVGTTNPNEYGKSVTEDISKELSEHFVVVSGMARGIDTIAHQSVIENGGQTIAVLGTGIEYCFPKENDKLYNELKKIHLFISEYPFSTLPNQRLIPFHNRIISGLSDSVLVTQCAEKSGAMITAGYALEQGKEVYCVPAEYKSSLDGTNHLIENGTHIYTSIDSLDIEEGNNLNYQEV